MKYFENFPQLVYGNNVTIDITRRVKIIDRSKTSPYEFYPYEITNHLRSDHVAEYYYDDAYLDWFIYLSNQIIDPYYDWYNRNDQLDELIRLKHGEIDTSQRKIKYFINNWFEHAEEEISVAHYDENISRDLKKYYDPVFSEAGKVMSYKRKRVDTTMNTNMIIDYSVNNYATGNSFTSGELVEIWRSGSQVGSGEALFSNSTIVRIQSVQGTTLANSTTNTFIVGETSNCRAFMTSSNTIITNISEEENSYWSPMYVYDYEVMMNEKKRTINLVDSAIVPFVLNEVRQKVSNT